MQEKSNNSFDRYISDICNEQKLNDCEERELSERIKCGDEKALEDFAKANLKFVISIANKYKNMGVDIEDLISEGNMALIKAARNFDAGRGVRFVSYASPYIIKSIEHAIKEQSDLLWRNDKCGNMSKRNVRQALSADAPLGGRENMNLLGIIENINSPCADAHLIDANTSSEMKNILKSLNERERSVLTLFFGIDCEKLNLAQIGDKMGLKRERVRQIRNKALRKIKRDSKQDFLS